MKNIIDIQNDVQKTWEQIRTNLNGLLSNGPLWHPNPIFRIKILKIEILKIIYIEINKFLKRNNFENLN